MHRKYIDIRPNNGQKIHIIKCINQGCSRIKRVNRTSLIYLMSFFLLLIMTFYVKSSLWKSATDIQQITKYITILSFTAKYDAK